MRGKCALNEYQPDEALGRGERVNTLGTCPVIKQKVGQHSVFLGFAEIQRFYVGSVGGGPAESIWDVQYSDRRLDFGRRDLVFFEFLVEGAARDPETLRGLLDTPTLLLKHALDVLLFELQQREIGVEKS